MTRAHDLFKKLKTGDKLIIIDKLNGHISDDPKRTCAIAANFNSTTELEVLSVDMKRVVVFCDSSRVLPKVKANKAGKISISVSMAGLLSAMPEYALRRIKYGVRQ